MDCSFFRIIAIAPLYHYEHVIKLLLVIFINIILLPPEIVVSHEWFVHFIYLFNRFVNGNNLELYIYGLKVATLAYNIISYCTSTIHLYILFRVYQWLH